MSQLLYFVVLDLRPPTRISKTHKSICCSSHHHHQTPISASSSAPYFLAALSSSVAPSSALCPVFLHDRQYPIPLVSLSLSLSVSVLATILPPYHHDRLLNLRWSTHGC